MFILDNGYIYKVEHITTETQHVNINTLVGNESKFDIDSPKQKINVGETITVNVCRKKFNIDTGEYEIDLLYHSPDDIYINNTLYSDFFVMGVMSIEFVSNEPGNYKFICNGVEYVLEVVA